MSSRGKTVAGTDGTDHTFRETIAQQYKISAVYKSKLKLILVIQLVPLMIIFLHLFQNDWGVKVTNYVLPVPSKWEYLYMFSLFSNMVGYFSLPRNDILRLSIYIWSTFIIGFGSIAWGAWVHYPELATLIKTGQTRSYFFGYPLIAFIYLLLAFSAELHILGLSYSFSLSKAWNTKGKKQR